MGHCVMPCMKQHGLALVNDLNEGHNKANAGGLLTAHVPVKEIDCSITSGSLLGGHQKARPTIVTRRLSGTSDEPVGKRLGRDIAAISV